MPLHIHSWCCLHAGKVGDREYFFGTDGLVSGPALSSHRDACTNFHHYAPTEVLHIGFTLRTGDALLKYMQQEFQPASYDVLLKNCNAFTDAALYFLTRTRLDGRFSRLERLAVSTRPFSMRLLKHRPNPQAEAFCIEAVIARCDAFSDPAMHLLAPNRIPWS